MIFILSKRTVESERLDLYFLMFQVSTSSRYSMPATSSQIFLENKTIL
ncbi:MAG: hypothetical protein ACLFQJ_10910 [Campylobacterales bacterium]